jgi:carbon monoxide dehydrogenase subunit G
VKLSSSFTVPAAADKVVALFLDPQTMRSCIPGCEELVQTDERHYQGTLVNEVAHVRFKAGFTAEIVSVAEAVAGPAVVHAVLRGEDRRLGSTIRMDATLRVSPIGSSDAGSDADQASEVAYEFELAIRGKLGRLGESVIRRRTAEVERQFAEALSAVCSGRPLPQQVAAVAARLEPDDAAAVGRTPDHDARSQNHPIEVAAHQLHGQRPAVAAGLDVAGEAHQRLLHVFGLEPQPAALGQVLLDPSRHRCARAHAALPGHGSATATNALWLSLA